MCVLLGVLLGMLLAVAGSSSNPPAPSRNVARLFSRYPADVLVVVHHHAADVKSKWWHCCASNRAAVGGALRHVLQAR